MRQKIIISFFVLFSFLHLSHAQYSEIGVGAGSIVYYGDLTELSFVSLSGELKIANSIFYRYHFNEKFSSRIQFLYGTIAADDKNVKIKTTNFDRNLNFRSPVYEISLVGEVNLYTLITNNNSATFVPYLFLGIGGLQFNPQGKYNDTWYDLQPLGTSGQGLAAYPDRKKYSLRTINIPFGLHLKTHMTQKLAFGLEAGFRKHFTDYLDDVSVTTADNDLIREAYGDVAAALAFRHTESSTGRPVIPRAGINRGNPKRKDWFCYVNFSISYNFISKGDWKRKSNTYF